MAGDRFGGDHDLERARAWSNYYRLIEPVNRIQEDRAARAKQSERAGRPTLIGQIAMRGDGVPADDLDADSTRFQLTKRLTCSLDQARTLPGIGAGHPAQSNTYRRELAPVRLGSERAGGQRKAVDWLPPELEWAISFFATPAGPKGRTVAAAELSGRRRRYRLLQGWSRRETRF